MTLGAYDTNTLVAKIEQAKRPMPYFARRFFNTELRFETEEVHFDEVLGERRMAPFVAPTVAGRVMKSKGSTMKSFRPAYVKPKHKIMPTNVLKRLPGEALMGSMSPEQRMQLSIAEKFVEQSEMVDNRIEWMVMEALKNGSITVEGEDYPKVVVSFNRNAGNSVTLTGTDRWNDSAPAPLTDLEDLSTVASKADLGAPITEWYMDPDAYKEFRKNADVKDLMDTNYRGSDAAIQRGPTTFNPEDEPMYMGQIGSFAIYVDARQYTDDTGSVVPYLASGEVIGVSGAIQGAQAFGAILDKQSMRAVRAFPKMWEEEDPSCVIVMTQSAPLPIPTRQNASVYLKVF